MGPPTGTRDNHSSSFALVGGFLRLANSLVSSLCVRWRGLRPWPIRRLRLSGPWCPVVSWAAPSDHLFVSLFGVPGDARFGVTPFGVLGDVSEFGDLGNVKLPYLTYFSPKKLRELPWFPTGPIRSV